MPPSSTRDPRVPRSRRYRLHDPAASQQRLAGKDWIPAQAPVGRPPHEVRRCYANSSYQAQSWKKPRRVVAKVEWYPGELYRRVGFIVTNLARPAERVVAFNANPGDACGSGAVVADQPAGKTDQDRRQGGQPRPLGHVPDGTRSRCS
jgi:hypothetical protein